MSASDTQQPVRAEHGMAASVNPLASDTGVAIMRSGGNAVDAAIAMAAVLNVVDPHMTGIGGDAFMLVYDAKRREIQALNASGRSAYAASLEVYDKMGWSELPITGIHSVSTPGALNGWVALLERYGSMSLPELLQPAIAYAEEGFAVNGYLAGAYRHPMLGIARWGEFPTTTDAYLVNGRPPEIGETLRQPNLAATFRTIAKEGHEAFYHGDIGKRLVQFCQAHGGLLDMRDLHDNRCDWVEPISTTYRGYTICELPPNTQGVALLEQLNIMEGFDVAASGRNAADTIHLQIEAKKLAFADLDRYITDPEHASIPLSGMLSKEYAATQRACIDPGRAATAPASLDPRLFSGENTTYFCVVDDERNCVSFINSLRSPWGSGLVAGDTGILLQNRGKDFSLDPQHVNRLEPHKRTFHTLNPAMVLKDGEPFLVIGCAGGEQQTQGLHQLLVNVIDFGMNPQHAIAAPRWSSNPGADIGLEPGIGDDVRRQLIAKGHRIDEKIERFGTAQMIMIDRSRDSRGELLGGSESRLEGKAAGY